MFEPMVLDKILSDSLLAGANACSCQELSIGIVGEIKD